ncbi:multidrug resistance protein EbrB [Paenibacillus sp. J31TS4]|uniref:DMT family transporter n=1 Tax=Paenibacillus sp. J31TS4 TaxID=2807195 RepID=UPI001B19633D|nr:multidrug efflux SMR transporter [Paenibacillus sp. J31TS4]GIP37179.1 multidrug resistance protein EbrB [Paenibacillus sp. J31TS4]
MKSSLYLALAIACEAFGSVMLKLSDGFAKLLPTIGVAAGFLTAFFLFSLSLKGLALSTAYAVWSGVGTALTVVLGVLLFQEALSPARLSFLLLLVAGIVVLTRAGTEAKSDGPDASAGKTP